MRALDRTLSSIDGMRQIIDFVEHLAGLTTYEEALARAGDDPDKAQSIHESYMEGIEDDWSSLIIDARNLCGITVVD